MQHGGHITKDLLGPRGAPLGGGADIEYLDRCWFSVEDSAPISAEFPANVGGPMSSGGDLNSLSVSGGELVFFGSALAYVRSSVQRSHVAGRVFSVKLGTITVGRPGMNLWETYRADAITTPNGNHSILRVSATRVDARDGGYSASNVVNIDLAGKTVWMVARQNGGFFYGYDERLFYVTFTRNEVTNYRNIGGEAIANSDFTLDDYEVYDVKIGGLTTEYGLATARVVTPGQDTVIDSESNAFIESKWTPQINEVITLRFRRTDDDNCLLVRCDQAAGTIRLYKREASVETELNASQAQVWATDAEYTIQIFAREDYVSVRVSSIGKHINVVTAYNQDVGGGKLSSDNVAPAFGELVSWRVDLTGFPFV